MKFSRHFVVRQLQFLGFLPVLPTATCGNPWLPGIGRTISATIVVTTWLVVICETLLNLRSNEIKEPLPEHEGPADIGQFTSNLIGTIFSLRILFRRLGTTMLITLIYAKGEQLSGTLRNVFTSTAQIPHAVTKNKDL